MIRGLFLDFGSECSRMVQMVCVILLLLAVFFLTVMYIDNHRFVVRRYRFADRRIKKGLTAVFVADLHEKDYGNNNEKVINTVRSIGPDLILVGGDLLVSGRFTNRVRKQLGIRHMYEGDGMDPPRPEDASWMTNSIPFIRSLTEIAPVYMVDGNHELRLTYHACSGYARMFEEAVADTEAVYLKNRGVSFVRGESGTIAEAEQEAGRIPQGQDTGITLLGLNLPIDNYRKFTKNVLTTEMVTELIGRPDRDRYTVLLTHSPVYFDTYAAWGADLSLCGHVHGGLMRLPLIGGVVGTGPSLFPKYSGGQYSKGDRKMVVTCGLGAHTLPVRIFNPGEVTVISLEPEENDDKGQQ